MLEIVYQALIDDDYIKSKADRNIKYYEYPKVDEIDNPKIIIDPLDGSIPKDFADNTWTTLDFQLQIDVWSKSRQDTQNLADKIRSIMWNELGFHQNDGTNEYDSDTEIFRNARRYRGKLYREDFDSL